MWYRADLKRKARACVSAYYWPLVVASLLLSVLTGEAVLHGWNLQVNFSIPFDFSWESSAPWFWFPTSMWVSGGLVLLLLDIFLIQPLIVGFCRFFLTAMDECPSADCLVQNLQQHYGNTVKVMFCYNLFPILWGLLLIIPGIVKSYEYRMVPYLLAEYPEMPRSEVFRASRELMYGNKLDTFVLDLSFLGWTLLSGLTMGLLGLFYVNPYRNMTNAQLYRAICQTVQTDGPTH